MSVRVLLADDQALVRAGLRMVLKDAEGIEVVGEAEDGRRALALAAELQPDVVVMDVRMPELDGIEATRRLLGEGGAAHRPAVLVLTTFDFDRYVYEALRAGASGFLLKDAAPERLAAAIHVVATGEALLDPAITRRIVERFLDRRPPEAAPPELNELTARERQVLELIARGRSNAEIAGELVVTAATVKTHVTRVLMKLGLRDRTQAVVFAYENGVVRPGQEGHP